MPQPRSIAAPCRWILSTLLAVAVIGTVAGAATTEAASANRESTVRSSGEDATWPQWRGPRRDATTRGAAWPDSLAGLEKGWSVEKLGPSYSGPIVGERRVFITETVGGDTEVVRALDRASGEELWRAAWPGEGSVPFFAAANGDWIRSTPAYDGETLFVGGMNEVVSAFDAATGELRWRVDFPARFGVGVPPFGFASSPLVEGDHLYLQAANSLVKLDKRSGKVIWRVAEESGEMTEAGAFSSPVIAELGGRRQLVAQSRSTLRGIDPESGEVLWSQPVPNFRGMNILTPTIWGDAVLTSAYRNGSFLYRVEPSAGGFETETAWQYKASGNMSSPVIVGDHAYLHLGNGRLTCIDLESGEATWTSTPFGKYWSLAARGDKILALDQRGELLLLRADPETLRLLDRRTISDQDTWAHLAVAGDELFVRDLGALTAWRWPAGGAPAAAR